MDLKMNKNITTYIEYRNNIHMYRATMVYIPPPNPLRQDLKAIEVKGYYEAGNKDAETGVLNDMFIELMKTNRKVNKPTI